MEESLFGTDGIRGIVGNYPITESDYLNIGKSIAYWMMESGMKSVIVGFDTRPSSPLLNTSLINGLLHYKTSVHSAGLTSTPYIFHATTKGFFDCGIMITASHNPSTYNGIKIFTKNGKLNPKEEYELTDLLIYSVLTIDPCRVGSLTYDLKHVNHDFYWNDIIQKIKIPPLQKKIVIDFAYGSQSVFLNKLIETNFFEIIPLHASLDNGHNINNHVGAIYPKTLQAEVLKHNADAGFAFDGDGDRICMVTQDGSIKTGDEIIGFLMSHPYYQQSTSVVGTIISNKGLENYVKNQNKKFYRTPVGDKYVADIMKQKNTLLGGENSGHIILQDFINTSDGLFTLLKIIETAHLTNNWSFTSFEPLFQASSTLPLTENHNLSDKKFDDIIKKYNDMIQDGMIVIRLSGTEFAVRILVESESKEKAIHIEQLIYKDLEFFI